MKVRRSQYTADGVWVWTPSIGCGPNARSAFQSRRLYLRTFSRCTSCIELVSVGARVTTLVSLWIELWTCRVQLLLPPQPQTYSGSEVRRRAQLIGKPVPHRPTILELHSILVDIGTGWAQRCGLECQHRCSSTISSRRGGSWGKRRLSVGGWSSPFLSSPSLPLPQSSSLPRLHTASASSFSHIRCNKYRKMYNSWFETLRLPRLPRLWDSQDSETPKTLRLPKLWDSQYSETPKTPRFRDSICIFGVHFCFHSIVTLLLLHQSFYFQK